MRNRKLLIVAGAILLLGVLLFSATVLADETEGVWNFVYGTTSEVVYVRNTSTGQGLEARTGGTQAVYGVSTGSAGDGVYGYASGSYGWGLRGYSVYSYGAYARSYYGIGLYGAGGTQNVGDYGGYFYGYDGVRVVTGASGGYGVWATVYGTYGRGIYAYASGSYGIGTYGYSPYYIGAYGYGDEYGVYGYGDVGVYGRTRLNSGEGVYGRVTTSYSQGVQGYTSGYATDGVYGLAYGSYGYGLRAYASGSYARGLSSSASGYQAYGGVFTSSSYRGLYANGASGWYDAYFPDFIYAGGTVISSDGWSVEAFNAGTETLNPGDLVSFVAMGDRMSVEKANGANGGAIVGVVTAAYIIEAPPVAIEGALPEAEKELGIEPMPERDQSPLAEPEKDAALPEGFEPPAPEEAPAEVEGPMLEIAPALPAEAEGKDLTAEADVGYMADASVEPGGFAIVLIQGFTQVNVNASVEAGQWLVAGDIGVTAISERQLAWAERRGDVVIGRALQAAVDGQVWVYVNFR